jgi:HAD superfamily hydrolase (TIGR01509 family)
MSAVPLSDLGRATLRAVICDMDGLLLDSERLDRRLWQEVARRRGLCLPDKVHAALIGYREEECLARLEAFFGSDLDMRAMQAEVDAAWLSEVNGPGIPLKAGVARLFDFLDAHRIPRALATSSSREKTTLCLGPLVSRFDAIVCGDEVPSGKPAPDVYLRAAGLLAVDPAHCLALEDSVNGVRAAKAAGMTVIVVPDLVEATAEARYVQPTLDHVVASLAAMIVGTQWIEHEKNGEYA